MDVLFVDDEVMILKAIKRALFRTGWKVHLAISGAKALQILEQENIDFIVSDMRMPVMNGADLLEEVAKKHPQTVRIILSGFSDEEAAKRASFVAHQWFNKPCQPEQLKVALDHINTIRSLLPVDKVQHLVGQIKTLPTPPKIYMRLNVLLNDDTIDMDKISQVIAEDPGLVAKILQLTNSSFFSHGKPAENLTEAITRLGVDLVCSIVIAAETFSQLEDFPGLSVEDEQKHSLSTARLAATMVEPNLKQETVIAALLHNIGKFILYKVCPQSVDDFLKHSKKGMDNLELEREFFYTDHTQLAGYLLHLWNFSYPLIESIVLHRQPKELVKMPFASSAAIYVASQLLLKQPLDDDFIRYFELKDKIPLWKKRAAKYA